MESQRNAIVIFSILQHSADFNSMEYLVEYVGGYEN